MLLNVFSKQDKFIATFSAAWGWICSLFLLDIRTFSWEFISKGCIGIAMSGVTVLLGLVMKDFYAIKIKHRLFKTKHNAKTDHEQAA